jgi:type 1 fimbria pilin
MRGVGFLGKGGRLRQTFVAAALIPALACAVLPSSLEAATGNVVFYGSLSTNNNCAITVNQNGRLGVRPDLRELSSKLAGGVAGIATVRAFGSFRLSAITPSVYIVAPNGGDTNVTRQVLFSGVKTFGGGATFAEHDGSIPERINGNSETRVTMHFTGTRTGTNYPTGNYKALVVLRCE